MNSELCDSLLMSPELNELVELLKTGDGLLDIINLREVQHSSIMAWMFDPREGHGQGDSILRDLLASASVIASGADSVLDKGSETAKFFKHWTPSRIRTGGFNSSFILTEYSCGEKSGRMDLLIIDPVNRFFVVIENKAGAPLGDSQLRRYREECERWLRDLNRFKGYKCALLAMDRSFSEEEEVAEDVGQSITDERKHWVLIGYSWLSLAAQRATLNIHRGNAAARLIQTYCRQQTDWRSETDVKVDELAGRLWEKYLEPVQQLTANASNPGKYWIGDSDTENRSEDLLRTFAVQNRDLVRALKQNEGLRWIRKRLLTKNVADNHVRISQAKLDLLLSEQPYAGGDGVDEWKVYLRARRVDADVYAIILRVDIRDDEDDVSIARWREYVSTVSGRTVRKSGRRCITRRLEFRVPASEVCDKLLDWKNKSQKAVLPK